MLPNRTVLHQELVTTSGTNRVYFQPPENIKLQYPCVIYTRSSVRPRHANDQVYTTHDLFTVTYISKDPDDQAPDRMLSGIRGARFDRSYASNNLHHTVLIITTDRRNP